MRRNDGFVTAPNAKAPEKFVLKATTQIWILSRIVAFTVAMQLFLKRTWFGNAMRAVTQDSVGGLICD